MSELTDFLLARIAEDEVVAKAAIERMDVGDGWSVARWEWHAAGQHESQPRPTNYAIIEGAPNPARVPARRRGQPSCRGRERAASPMRSGPS